MTDGVGWAFNENHSTRSSTLNSTPSSQWNSRKFIVAESRENLGEGLWIRWIYLGLNELDSGSTWQAVTVKKNGITSRCVPKWEDWQSSLKKQFELETGEFQSTMNLKIFLSPGCMISSHGSTTRTSELDPLTLWMFPFILQARPTTKTLPFSGLSIFGALRCTCSAYRFNSFARISTVNFLCTIAAEWDSILR